MARGKIEGSNHLLGEEPEETTELRRKEVVHGDALAICLEGLEDLLHLLLVKNMQRLSSLLSRACSGCPACSQGHAADVVRGMQRMSSLLSRACSGCPA